MVDTKTSTDHEVQYLTDVFVTHLYNCDMTMQQFRHNVINGISERRHGSSYVRLLATHMIDDIIDFFDDLGIMFTTYSYATRKHVLQQICSTITLKEDELTYMLLRV